MIGSMLRLRAAECLPGPLAPIPCRALGGSRASREYSHYSSL